nr:MAG TPA: hypothetical protein [Bacteriophage sp.]
MSIDLYGKQYYNRITAREHDRKARGEGRPGEQNRELAKRCNPLPPLCMKKDPVRASNYNTEPNPQTGSNLV